MDMAEISTADAAPMTDAATVLRTAASGEDPATSEFRLAITSENFDKHHPGPISSLQSPISTILETSPLEEKPTTAVYNDHVTFGNNHSSISNQMCKTTSGGAGVQNWESSIPYLPLKADSTSSANISGKGFIPSMSPGDDTASTNMETVVVSKNIATVAGDPCAAPITMTSNEDNVAASSGISFIPTTVLGDTGSATNSEEAIPDSGDIRNISSGEVIAGSADTFSAVSTGDTAITTPSLGSVLVFVDFNDTQGISSPEDHSTTAGDIATAPGDSNADPVADAGEISHITFKEASPSLPGDATVLLLGGTAGVFTTDTSGIDPTFSPTTESITSDQSSPVVFPASTDGVNVSKNTTNTFALETTTCPITTDSGDTSVIAGMNATAFGNISTTHLGTAVTNESFLIIPGSVTNTAGISGATAVTPRNMKTTPGKKPIISVTHGDTGAPHNGLTSSILSCGKADSLTEDAHADSENSIVAPDSLTISGNFNANICNAITGFVGNTGREDAIAITPEKVNQMEPSGSPQNGTIIIAEENPPTIFKKSSGDSTSKASFRGRTTSPVTGSANTQRYAFTNRAGCVTMNCGSTIVSEGLVGDKGTTTSFGGSAVSGNDTGMMHREDNSSTFDYASITSASEETFIVPPDITMNIATTISSQNASEQSAESQVGQCSETITRKTSTVFGSSTNIHRDTDTTGVALTSPPNAATTTAAITSTTTVLEDGNTATSRRLPSTSQNINDVISEQVTASPMSEDGTEFMKSGNTATIHFENAVTTVTASVSLEEFESTHTTSLLPREATSSTGNDTMKACSGNTLSFCVSASATGELPATLPKETPISIGKPINEFNDIHGDTLNETVCPDSVSANNIVQDRKLSIAIIADDSKTTSGTTTVVPGDITSATDISLLSRALNTGALGDAANNTSDFAFINATSSGDASEDADDEGRITSGHTGSETIFSCVSTPDSLFSIQTNFQETSNDPGDTSTVLGYTTNILEGAQVCHEFASAQSKIPTVLVQTPKFNDTTTILDGYISTEATRQSERAPTANVAGLSVGDKIQSGTFNTPVTIGTKNITSHKGTENLNESLIPVSISTSVISGIFEATPVPEESRNTTAVLDANSAFSARDAAIIITTTSNGATAHGGSGGFMKTTTLLKDTTTFTTTSTGATSTVTALKDTVMTTQTSMRDIATISRNSTTTILEDSSTLRETVTSEKMAATTPGNIMAPSKVLIPETRSCGGIPVGNINPKETLSNYPSDSYVDRITSDSLATANIINILSDAVSAANNASSLLEITTSPEGIMASRNNCTTTCVQISIQSQTTIPEAPSTVTEKASFAMEENIAAITTGETEIAHPVPKGATMTNTQEDETSVSINSSESITNTTAPSVSPREVVAATCIPLEMTGFALGKTVPLGQKFCSRNDAHTSASLGEVCAHPDYPSPTEAFSTLASTPLSKTSCSLELVTPCLSTISVSEHTSEISETSTGFGNAITPILFLRGTDQSVAIGDTTSSIATTGTAAFADPKSITIAPEEMHTLVRTTLDESRESVATSTPELIPTTFGAAVTYTGGKTVGADVANYMIGSDAMIVSEEIIAAPGDNFTDLAILRDKNTVTAIASIHARTSTAHEEAINVDGDTTSEPTKNKGEASLILTCTAMISFTETLTPGTTTAPKDTDILAATSFTEAFVSKSTSEFPLASSSEATIFPAETSTDGATFPSGPTAASRNTTSNKGIADEDFTVVTTSSSTSSSANIPFTTFDVGRKAFMFEDDACSASGHPHTPENEAFTPENVAPTVPEDTTILSGNTSKISDGPVIITLGKGTSSPAKETPTTVEGGLIAATATPRDTNDTITTTTESSVTAPRMTIVVPGEASTINPGEKSTATDTPTEIAMITGGTSEETGMILTATPRETNIATFGNAVDSTTSKTFVAPGETLIISPRETLAATSGEITGTTYTFTSQRSDTSHEDASAIPQETITGILRETAPVKLGKVTETTTTETNTMIHRKLSTAVPQKMNSGASPADTPGEIPTTAFAEAAHKASPLSVQSNNTPTGVTSEGTSMVVPSKMASASQGKNRTGKQDITCVLFL